MSEASQPIITDAPPELNPALDRAQLARSFRAPQRIHITNVLTNHSAERVYRALVSETSWTTVHNVKGKTVDLPKLSVDERSKISFAAWEWARSNFAFLYDNHRLSHDGEPYADQSHYLAKFVAFLNSREFIALMREVTGLAAIAYADAQATLYRPGDFLTRHDDTAGAKNRVAAYVFSFTPKWKPDWGGVLEFLNDRGQITAGYVPEFNSLNVFAVPQVHLVSQVALFGGLRYSITGWLRSF